MGGMGMMGMGGMGGMGMMGMGMGNCGGPVYVYGESRGHSCPGSDVSEADCLEAVQSLLPDGQVQGRTHLVAGSWSWVPPGCSVQSHLTQGQAGDWAAHYNRNPTGRNDGGYTPLCEMSRVDCNDVPGSMGMGMMGMMGIGGMGMMGN